MSPDSPGEFSFLADDAAAVGRSAPLPSVRRVALTDEVSALSWGQMPAKIVLAHGVALNAHTWDATVLAWPDPTVGFLALDLPGHGDSPWRADADYNPATLAGPVEEALVAARSQGLLVPGPAMVGHSLGGLIALELLRERVVSFSRLVLLDILPLPGHAARTVAAFLDGPSSFDSRDEIVQRALAFGLGGDPEALERAVYLNTRLDNDGRVVWKHHFGVLGGAGLRVPDDEAVWPVIAESSMPIDLIAATMSIIDADAVDRFSSLRPAARVLRLAGGHNLQEDAPVELARALADLLSD
jgi:pimeloyl-ACP methyl ester carboxylesterase